MGINQVRKRGKIRLELRKRWPDGTTYRRYFPNEKKARDTLTRIESSILEGTWREMQAKLKWGKGIEEILTIEKLSETYLDEYCRAQLRRQTRHRRADMLIFLMGEGASWSSRRCRINFCETKPLHSRARFSQWIHHG